VLKEQRSKDPYKSVRRVNPPVDFVFINRRGYSRSKTRKETDEILEEELEDLFEE